MNHKYILLLWPLAKIFRKPIVLWKTHRGKQAGLKTAIKLSNKVLTASKFSLDYSGRKKKVLGHGINTELFSLKPYSNSKIKKIISVGRITPIKNQYVLVEIANYLINKLNFKNVKFEIIGRSVFKKDIAYFKKINQLINKYQLSNYFIFKGNIPNKKMPEIYKNSEILIDLAGGAGLDKAPLEAMSCGRIALASQPALQNALYTYKKELSINFKKPKDIAEKIKKYLELENKEKEKIGKDLRKIIVRKHSLDNLSDKLIEIFKEII